MKRIKKGPFKNSLAAIRRQNHLKKSEVAALLGYRTNDRLIQYETGIKTPNLKTALKLAAIYNVPIRVMLDGYYNACREEIKRETEGSKAGAKRGKGTKLPANGIEFCTFEERMECSLPSENAISQVRRHATNLIRTTAQQLGHL